MTIDFRGEDDPNTNGTTGANGKAASGRANRSIPATTASRKASTRGERRAVRMNSRSRGTPTAITLDRAGGRDQVAALDRTPDADGARARIGPARSGAIAIATP